MPLSPEVRAVTFDVGGTLIECFPSVGHIYAEIARQYGEATVEPRMLNQQFRRAWKARKNFHHSREDWAALVDATFDGLIATTPSKSFFNELYCRFSEASVWRIFEDVVPALEALSSRRLKLGVISNWDDRLRPLLDKLSLRTFFDDIVVSCEVDAPKPHPEIFRYSAERLGCPPAHIVHVGDDFNNDIVGPRATGFQALLLDRGAAAGVDGVIRSLSELL